MPAGPGEATSRTNHLENDMPFSTPPADGVHAGPVVACLMRGFFCGDDWSERPGSAPGKKNMRPVPWPLLVGRCGEQTAAGQTWSNGVRAGHGGERALVPLEV